MAYNELIKNFERIREYMREFYVYGFKSRYEYDRKSARSYDDERRRIESWLGEHMRFHHTADGKNVFISIDSRISHHNPLYKAWKSMSFTDGDITLHFILFDILHSPCIYLSLNEIMDRLDNYLSCFRQPKIFDTSTVRKKLKEYEKEGLICTQKKGKALLYRRADMTEINCSVALDFFSEVAPCGVIGSFLLDKLGSHTEPFAFKHHYITQALDSDILCTVFDAINRHSSLIIKMLNRRTGSTAQKAVVPLRVFVSVQNGRQYVMCYIKEQRQIRAVRLDRIISASVGKTYMQYNMLRKRLDNMQPHIWGVTTQGNSDKMEHVEFTVRYNDGEEYIHRRLEREKRCGCVEKLDEHTSRFTADVYNSGELVPWIRTFICRITSISFSDKSVEEQFKNDLDAMYGMYDLGGGGKQ